MVVTSRDCAHSIVPPSDRANVIGSMIPNMKEYSRPYFTSLEVTTRFRWRQILSIWTECQNLGHLFFGSLLVYKFKNTQRMKILITWANSSYSGG